jgi:diadenosine tetraphosphate (Ap4A) HIT family hydrolase
MSTTWPPDWTERVRGKDCPMCAQGRPDEEAVGYWREVLRVASAIERHYRPVKLNYQLLGNAVPHLHTHLLPRFADDPSPGRPLEFPEGGRSEIPADRLRRDALALRALV